MAMRQTLLLAATAGAAVLAAWPALAQQRPADAGEP